MLNAVAELLGIFHVLFGQLGNAFGVDFVKLERNPKGNRGQNGQLVRSINAFHIKRRIGFGITQGLRFCQYIIKGTAFIAHLGHDEVASAINNASQPFDFIGG